MSKRQYNNISFSEMEQFPRSVEEARKVGSKHYFTGLPCKNGHLSLRSTSCSKCLNCDQQRQALRRADPNKKLLIKSQRKKRYQDKKDKINKARRELYASNSNIKMRALGYDLKRKFGISLNDYNEMLHRQGGACAICRSKNVGRSDGIKFAVDHDHNTGKIRGLLCKSCNTLLGNAKESIETLKAAKAYLQMKSLL